MQQPSISASVSRHQRQPVVWLIVGVLLLAGADSAWAAGNPVLNAVFDSFYKITDQMNTQIGKALDSPQVNHIASVLFTSMALGLFVWRFAGYALRGFDLADMMELILTIFFVYMLLHSYKAIFPSIYQGALYVGNMIGNELSQTPPGTSMASNIFDKVFSMHYHMKCDFPSCLGEAFLAVPATIIGWVMSIILGIMATLVELWCRWGFLMAYAIGWVFIPFLLYERLAFLGDGFFKFSWGMVVYCIVANVNLGVVYISVELITNSGSSDIDVGGFFDILGLMIFQMVGIATLWKTGKFASAIVMGAGGGGIVSMAQTAARITSAALSGGAGAVGGAL